jgi:hypothetical protein
MRERFPYVFDLLSPYNRLLALEPCDRLELSNLLSEAGALMKSKRLRERKNEFDAGHLVAEQCIALAAALREHIFSKPRWKEERLIKSAAILPGMLEIFGKALKRRAGLSMKKGQAHKDIPRRYLVEASEFVRLTTGQYHDDDFAELAKYYLKRTTRGSHVNGAWIADRRNEFRTSYPNRFLDVQASARRRSGDYLSDNPVVLRFWQELVQRYGAGPAEKILSSEANSTSK